MKRTSTFFSSLFISVYGFAQVMSIEPMFENRKSHTLTSIFSNRAIACGGFDNGVVQATAEIYDLQDNQWTYADGMTTSRVYHTADLIDQNRVILIGGYSGADNLSSTEIYDIENDQFTTGPTMSFGASAHRTAFMDNGNYLLVCGGYDGFENTDSCQKLNLTTMQFESMPHLLYGRSTHAATTLPDGRVLVTGGFNPDYGFQMDECEIFDPQTNEWTEVAPMNSARDNHSAIHLYDGKVLVSGGRYFNSTLNLFEGQTSCEIYDVATNTWTPTGSLNSGQSYHQMVQFNFAKSSLILLPGSVMNSGFEVETTYSPTEIFDPISGVWTNAYDFGIGAEGRFAYAAATLTDGILVTGGFVSQASTGDFYAFGGSVYETSVSSLEIFPNPSSGQIRLKNAGGSYQYRITEVNGRLVQSGMIIGTGAVDVMGLPQGMYWITLADEKSVVTRKLVIDQSF